MKKAQIKQTCQNSYLKHSESDSKHTMGNSSIKKDSSYFNEGRTDFSGYHPYVFDAS